MKARFRIGLGLIKPTHYSKFTFCFSLPIADLPFTLNRAARRGFAACQLHQSPWGIASFRFFCNLMHISPITVLVELLSVQDSLARFLFF